MRSNNRIALVFLLSLGFAIRLVVALSIGWKTLRNPGGDELWYLANGLGLFTKSPEGVALGITYAAHSINIAPLYLVFNGLLQQIWDYPYVIGIIRIIQCVWGVLVCYLAFDIGTLLADDERVGWVVAIALTFSIPLIYEPSNILTEMMYITLMLSAIWLYCHTIATNFANSRWWAVLLVGVLLGLATLTRAASLLFPLGIAGHVLLVAGRSAWKRGIQLALLILIGFGVTISTWTVYNAVRYDRLVIVSNQFFPTLWRGATDEDSDPRTNDALLGDQTPREQSAEIIQRDVTGYLTLRATELASAYLQPYGTVPFGDESLRVLALDWVLSGFSLSGLGTLITSEGFFIKLLIYIWHYVALIGGIIGIWLTRKHWVVSLPMIGFILYTTLLHLVLQALPRYIYPTYVFYWIFAAVALVALWDALFSKHEGAASV